MAAFRRAAKAIIYKCRNSFPHTRAGILREAVTYPMERRELVILQSEAIFGG